MENQKPRRLRWTLARALVVTFVLLWLGLVALLQTNRINELDTVLDNQYIRAKNTIQTELLPNYPATPDTPQPWTGHALVSNLSSLAQYSVPRDGGMAIAIKRGDEISYSQITLGDGIERLTGHSYTLYFDESLTDQGQKAFARWMIENRNNWGYNFVGETAYPPDDSSENAARYARVSGVKMDDAAMQVQTIDLVWSNKTEKRIFTADISATCDLTVDMVQLNTYSVLLPAWHSDGKPGPIDMDTRLENYRQARSIIDRELAGERFAVNSSNGQLSYGTDWNGNGYYLATHYNPRTAAFREQWGLYLSTFVLAAALLLTLSTHLSRKVTCPMETLSRDVETGRCQTDGTITELNTLAAAFNGAQEKLSQQLERERNFTRAAAHELKTPLAVLRAHAEALQEDIDPQKRDAYLAVVLDEADRMAALTGNLLELSRLEGGTPLKQEPVELAALVREVFDRLALPMEQKGLSVTMETAETWVSGDSERLREVVDNLATNVLRYCPNGKAVRVTLTQEGDMACLRVYNEGEPIPEDDLPHLWEPFYRVDRSRSRQSGGTGLGLAIVRATVAAHGGTCTVENVPGGVAFGVRLPLMAENK